MLLVVSIRWANHLIKVTENLKNQKKVIQPFQVDLNVNIRITDLELLKFKI